MRGQAESSGPTSSAHDQAGVGPLLASQGRVWLSPDSRSWGCALDEWLPRRRRAEGDRRQARGGREAGTGWSSGWEAGAARGFSWYTDRCVAEGIAVRVLAAVDQHTCLFPANPQSPAMESFHAALQIARALCTVPPRIAAPEHAVLDFSTVGRSAHRVIRAQLAALLRDTQRHLDRRDAVAADTALKHVSSTWRVRTPRSSVWSFYLTQDCLLSCDMLPSSEPHDKANVRSHSLCHYDTSTAPLLRAHTISHALYTHRRRSVTFPSIPSHF